jgi:hypothetical protein
VKYEQATTSNPRHVHVGSVSSALGPDAGAGLFGVDFVVPHPNPDWLKGTGAGVQGAEAWFNGSVAKFSPAQ